MEDMLETFVAAKWPQLEIARQALVGFGVNLAGAVVPPSRSTARSVLSVLAKVACSDLPS